MFLSVVGGRGLRGNEGFVSVQHQASTQAHSVMNVRLIPLFGFPLLVYLFCVSNDGHITFSKTCVGVKVKKEREFLFFFTISLFYLPLHPHKMLILWRFKQVRAYYTYYLISSARTVILPSFPFVYYRLFRDINKISCPNFVIKTKF